MLTWDAETAVYRKDILHRIPLVFLDSEKIDDYLQQFRADHQQVSDKDVELSSVGVLWQKKGNRLVFLLVKITK